MGQSNKGSCWVATAEVTDGCVAHHRRKAAARRQEVKGEPEILLRIAHEKADDPEEDHQDLEEAFAPELTLEVLWAKSDVLQSDGGATRGWRCCGDDGNAYHVVAVR